MINPPSRSALEFIFSAAGFIAISTSGWSPAVSIAVEHPEREAQRPHVLAAQSFLVAEAERLHGIEGQLRNVEMDELPLGEAAVLQRILVIASLGEVAGGEFAFVGDDQAAVAQRLDVHLQRRRVHGDENVGLVAGGVDRAAAEIDLEGGDAEGRALRRADFRREIGKCGEVVAGERGRERELSARQLHTVAAITREADDDGFLGWMCLGFLRGQNMGRCSHERNYLTP